MATSPFKAVIRAIIEHNKVLERIDRKRFRVLSQIGAYTRGGIRNIIRPQKKSTKASRIAGRTGRLITFRGERYFVPHGGKVLDGNTFRPVPTEVAKQVRQELQSLRKKEGAGKPPRRGPNDYLRKFTKFAVDFPDTVVAGPQPFASQPKMVGRVSVPELLDKGGHEYIGGQLVKYDPHPYLAPVEKNARKRFAQLIERVKL